MVEILEVKSQVTEENHRRAAEVRQKLNTSGTFLVNLMASPGAGKTTTLLRTIAALQRDYRIGVMEADVDATVDAESVAALGVRALQLHTGGSCHMDADMTWEGLKKLGYQDLDLVFLENIGNLVCPAEFDVGAQKKVMILSVPEGDDKPLKYPLMFSVSDCLLINKIDTREIFNFDPTLCETRARTLNPEIAVYPLSAVTGEGFDAWVSWLRNEIEEWRNQL